MEAEALKRKTLETEILVAETSEMEVEAVILEPEALETEI